MVDDINQTEEKAWKSSFKLNGKTYAASLFWQPLLNEDKPLPEIQEAAETIMDGADLYVTRTGKSSQFGLAASSQGFSKDMISAAIALVTGLGNLNSFLGVFKVDSGWWYVCFRNDVLLSDGDTLFVNEKDAKNQFISMLAVPDWEAIYAPEEWEIEDTKTLDLAEVLAKGLPVKLQKVAGNNDLLMLLVIVACFVAIAWFAFSSLKDMFFSAPEEPVIAPIEVEQQELPPEVKPWEELNNPADIMKNCYLATQKVVQTVTPGWELEGVTCTPETGLVTSWKRVLGRLTWIEQALDVSGLEFSSRVLSRDGNTVMVTLPIGEISKIVSPPEFNEIDLVDTINDINQTLNISMNISPKQFTSSRGTVYKLVDFHITSNNDPLTWLDFLSKFSGLTITSITYNINSAEWSYEGEIYEL